MKYLISITFLTTLFIVQIQSQNLTQIDTSLFSHDSTKLLYSKFGNVHLSGYLQPQFQMTQTEGAANYSGGNFLEHSKNRFMLRRARFKIDYLYNHDKKPNVYFSLQVDATERGVYVRDMFGVIIDPKWKRFRLYGGLFALPFGFETNLSSGVREVPERGRMNQILMPRERDLGVMLAYEPVFATNKWRDGFVLKLGLFNGTGLTHPGDPDSYKDLVGKFDFAPFKLSPNWSMNIDFSGYYGAVKSSNSRKVTFSIRPEKTVRESDNASNLNRKIERRYFGTDMQIARQYPWGKSEFRAEYIMGRQPGSSQSSNTYIPGINESVYLRPFHGAYFYFLQHLGHPNHQILLKYDFYDPNRAVSGMSVGSINSHTTMADIAYETVGMGYSYIINDHLKATIFYDFIFNEATALPDFRSDIDDDVFTTRVQFSF